MALSWFTVLFSCVVICMSNKYEIKKSGSDYYLTTSSTPSLKIPLFPNDVILRKVVSDDLQKDLYVGEMKFIGVKKKFLIAHTEWVITHTDNEVNSLRYLGAQMMKEEKATGAELEKWLNEPVSWDWGYAGDAAGLTAISANGGERAENINTVERGRIYKGECIEKKGPSGVGKRLWKWHSTSLRVPWHDEYIGLDPRDRKGLMEELGGAMGKLTDGWIGKIFGGKKANPAMQEYDDYYDDEYDEYEDDDEYLSKLERLQYLMDRLNRMEQKRYRN